ncbi:MAG: ABC-type Na+ efflux pump permease component-like protein [Ilumatobacteraceae bacterium]|nr:ABC-type Na+ efflux pump permease component-like protein [Ilumatobacteraceae bacterium]
MTTTRPITLVMTREVRQRLRSRSFAITTALLCLGVIGLGLLNRALRDDGSPTKYDVAVVGQPPDGFAQAAAQTAQAVNLQLHVQPVATRSQADQQVRDGDVDIAIDASTGELVSDHEPADELAAVVNTAWRIVGAQRAADQAGLDSNQIDEILSPPALRGVVLDTGHGDDQTAKVVGMAAAVVLFITINAFGGMVLTGVVEEKSTGVVEVLLAHVRAHQLLMGKVFGIGLVALTQMTATVAASLVALRISGSSIPRDVWIGLPSTLVWFVLGFVLYSTLFALAGSFVSRQEDAQGAAAPISLLFTAGYLTVFVLGNNPYSTVTRVVSVLPPFAPLLMPLRVSVGAASVVEIVIALAGLVAATFGMLRLAGSVYGRTLLHRGSRLRWKQALRMRS